MMEVATDTSTALISAVLEMRLAKSVEAWSGDVLSSYVMCMVQETTYIYRFKSVNIVLLSLYRYILTHEVTVQSLMSLCTQYIPAEFDTA